MRFHRRHHWGPPEAMNITLTRENRIAAGIFSFVHRISPNCVRKVPRDHEPESIQAVSHEATIYTLLGHDGRIARWLSVGPNMGYIDIEWAVNGTLEDYIQVHEIRDPFRLRLARQIIEAVQYIHDHGIIHSDLCLRQFLVYEDCNARLSDFAASGFPGHEALGMENARHYTPRDPDSPNTFESDLFALGSTLYELMAGKPPYGDKCDAEIESLYLQGKFPCTDDILCSEVILGCWRKRFHSALDVLAAYNTFVRNSGFEASKNDIC